MRLCFETRSDELVRSQIRRVFDLELGRHLEKTSRARLHQILNLVRVLEQQRERRVFLARRCELLIRAAISLRASLPLRLASSPAAAGPAPTTPPSLLLLLAHR